MTTYLYSAVVNGAAFDFNPATDTLQVDGGLSSQNLSFQPIDSGPDAGRGWMLSQEDENGNLIKSFSLFFTASADPSNLYKLSATNLVFDNGSKVLMGDGTVGVGDDSTTVTLNGGSGDDTLVSFGGSQTLNGGDGNDWLVTMPRVGGVAGSNGTDVFNGGNGVDWLELGSFNSPEITQYTVNLATGTGSVAGNFPSTFTVSGIENIDGSDVKDSITGDANANVLIGADGNDTIDGGAGDDILVGGAGSDTLIGGAGADTVDYSRTDSGAPVGPVTVNLALGQATDDGQGGIDTISGIERVVGGWSNDNITGSDYAITGLQSDVRLVQVFMGNGGDDTLTGSALSGRTVVADYRSSTNAVSVNLGTGTASDGWGGTDTLTNIDGVRGGAGNDTLVGGSASASYSGTQFEWFEGMGGNDSINGGVGYDMATYQSATAGVTVNLAAGTATGDTSVGSDTLVSIEMVRGSQFGDSLTGSSASAEFFEGLGGNDTIDGGAGYDRVEFRYSATAGVVVNLSAAALAAGTYGSVDVAAAVAANRATDGQGGTDTLVNIEGAMGTDSNDVMIGADSNAIGYEMFEGMAGNDYIDGRGGVDYVSYGIGFDANDDGLGAIVNLGNTDLAGGTWQGVAFTGVTVGQARDTWGGTDRLLNIENASGSNYNDVIVGGAGDNVLQGGGGNDSLAGGLGNDSLAGGLGNDSMVGGAGNDTYDVDSVSDVVVELANEGVDTVKSTVTTTLSANVENLTLMGAAAINGTGNVLGNVLLGNAGNNVLNGGGAPVAVGLRTDPVDVLRGEGGNDTLDGGSSQASVWAFADYATSTSGINVNLDTGTASDGLGGTDTLLNIDGVFGSSYNDVLTGGSHSTYITTEYEFFQGGLGDDTIDGGSGHDVASYQAANGSVVINLAAGTASGADGNDILLNIEQARGSGYADTLIGSSGNDQFEGMGGNDSIDGGDGVDIVRYMRSVSAVNVNLGTGTATDGFGGTDTLTNIEGVRGSDYNDTLTGGAADESFQGLAGNDTISGGAGTDTVSYSMSLSGVTVNLGTGTATDGFGGTDSLSGIENVQGSFFNDTLMGDSSANRIEGLGGNDSMVGGAGADTLDAGTGADTVDGGTESDVLVVLGNFADYTVSRPTGTDTVLVNATTGENITVRNVETVHFADGDKLIGETWNNVSSPFDDLLTGTADNDLINGQAGNDTIQGLAGNDTLIGGAGIDRLIGGQGNDVYEVDVAGDVIVENVGEGTDQVNVNFAAAGTYTLSENVENATVISGATIAVNLTGNSGNNSLIGNDAANSLVGGAGNDTLIGGVGADAMLGGVGNDVYVVDNAADVVTEGLNEGIDTINSSLSWTLGTNVENLLLTGTAAINGTGNALGNYVAGNSASNVLNGGGTTGFVGKVTDPGDLLQGFGGADTLDGGSNQASSLAFAYYVNSAAAVNVNLATGVANDGFGTVDTLRNIDGVYGSAYNDTLTGGSDSTYITTKFEFFQGGLGDDVIDGGSGYDMASYQNATGSVNVNLATGTASGADGNDTLISIDQVRGSNFADVLTGDAGDNHLEGMGGDDTIDGGDGIDIIRYSRNTANGVNVTFNGIGSGTAIDGMGGTDTFTNIEGVRGSDFNDTMTGGDGDEYFQGLAGADTMDGGAGKDTVSYNMSLSGVTVNLATGSAVDSWGDTDTLLNIENIKGSSFNDSLTGSAGNNLIDGLEGNDLLAGGDGDDTLIGGAGNDTLSGGVGDDTVDYSAAALAVNVNLANGTATDGQAGTDTLLGIEAVRGSAFGDVLTGGAGNDKLEGLAGNDTLAGGAGADALYGGAGNDSISGEGGDDAIYGHEGNDVVDGGVGNDTVYLLDARDAYTVTRPSATDTVLTRIAGGETITLRNVEQVQFSDGLKSIAEVQANVPSGFADLLQGTSGNDTLDGMGDNDTLLGADGDDRLLGGTGNDSIDGGLGSDTLLGGVGNDTLIGGAGNDTYEVDNALDVISENLDEGTDLVNVAFTAAGTYVLSNNVENATVTAGATIAANVTGNALDNVLIGNAAANTLTGLAGNDTLDGGAGSDILVGGVGDDVYVVDVATDVVTELAAAGTDTVNVAFGLAGTYGMTANVENAIVAAGTLAVGVTGNDSANTITGNAGDNKLLGGLGNDTISGGAGADTLDGGQGDDNLVGGEGNDVYVVDSLLDVVTEAADEGIDRVETALSGLTLADNVDNLTYTGVSAFTGTGNALANSIVGGAGNDTLSGLDGNDTLTGNAGNDRLDGGTGNDSLVGGLGDDVYVVDAVGDVVVEAASAGTDRVETDLVSYTLGTELENLTYIGGADFTGSGQALNNVLTGGVGSDSLSGLVGNDTLIGNAGNDTLDGGAGVDSLVGGAGDDTYVVDVATDAVVEAIASGTDLVNVAFAAAGTYTLTAEVENAAIVNATVGVNLTGNALGNNLQGNAQANLLSGLDGADTLDGSLGNDTLDGGAGNDSLLGGAGNDSLLGGLGDDLLDAGTGVDIVDGGLGSDTLNVLGNYTEYTITRLSETDTRLLNAGTGENIILRGIENVHFADGTKDMSQVWNNTVGALSDSWTGTAGNDSIDGMAGNDTLSGLAGNDTLVGGTGNDSLIGGEGDDTYVVDVATDVIVEQAAEGTDQVNVAFTVAGTYTLSDNVENATVTAGATIAANVTGNALDNVLIGNAAANTLTGLAGNDTLDGGAGSDILVGGVGDDVYVVDVATDVVTELAAAGTDTVNVAFGLAGSYVMTANVENAIVAAGTLAVGVTGNDSANTITGNSGANNLLGGLGSDTISGGAGADTLDGGLGNDSLVGGVGDDVYVVDAAGDVVVENADEGSDRVITSLTTYTLGDNVENLRYSGTANFTGTGNALVNIIEGGAGNNTLYGLDGNDTLSGLAGNDTLDGGTGNDSLIGGTGNDTYLVDAVGDVVVEAVAAGTDTIQTGLGSYSLAALVNVENLIYSGAGNFTGTGNAAANVLTGSVGNDTLDGGIGSDTLIGGAGDDLYIVDAASDVVTEQAAAGTDRINTVLTSYTLGANIEELSYTGTAAFTGTGNALNNRIAGAGGADTLSGGDGNDTLLGGAGNDSLSGGNGDDQLEAGTIIGTGTDIVDGGAGNDTLFAIGNRGDYAIIRPTSTDTVLVNAATGENITLRNVENVHFADQTLTLAQVNDNITSPGDDVLTGTAGNNTMLGLGGNDQMNGMAGNDTLDGGSGNDTLDGGTGNDRLIGGVGDDVYIVDAVGDVVVEDSAAGTDRVETSTLAAYTLGANLENLRYVGSEAFNGVGNAQANVIEGGASYDLLYGAGGNDTLVGRAGNDFLDGGDGSDTYRFNLGDGEDIISQNDTGAANVDTLELTGSNTTLAIGTNDVSVVRGYHSYDDLVIRVEKFGQVDQVVLSNFFANDTIAAGGIDRVVFTGGDANVANDVVWTNAILAQQALIGNADDNTILGYANVANAMNGNGGNDWMMGQTLADTLNGGSGNDVLFGGAGNDSLLGGDNNDMLVGGAGNDILTGGAGDDTLTGGAGSDIYVFGTGSGHDLISESLPVGGAAPAFDSGVGPVYVAGAGDTPLAVDIDVLRVTGVVPSQLHLTRDGDDLQLGINGSGDQMTVQGFFNSSVSTIEQFVFDDGTVWTASTARYLVTQATSGNDALTGYVGADHLYGQAGNDTINGVAGNDTLEGGIGDDSLSGGDGNDSIIGGDGFDWLSGGSGADRFVFNTADALVNADTISDFVSGTDKIVLDDDVFAAFNATNSNVVSASEFVSGAGATATDANTHLVYDTTSGALYYDVDGVGGVDAVQIAMLGVGTHPSIAATDFAIIA